MIVISDISDGNKAERVKNSILCGLDSYVTNEIDYIDFVFFEKLYKFLLSWKDAIININ